MLPPAILLTDHFTAVSVDPATLAVNCCFALATTLTLVGDTVTVTAVAPALLEQPRSTLAAKTAIQVDKDSLPG